MDHEWEHDKPGGIGNLCLLGHRRAEDHGTDDLGGDGLEQIRAPRAAVAHVVPDEIRDDRGVPRVILRDARLHLSHQVGTHVGGFGVDAAAELREEGDERSAEAVADEHERHLVDARAPRPAHVEHEGVEREQHGDAEDCHGDDDDRGETPGSKRHHQRLPRASSGGARDSHVGSDADPHADVAGRRGCERAGAEGEGGENGEGLLPDAGVHLFLGQRPGAVDEIDGDRDDARELADEVVLRREEAVGALADGVAHLLHVRGSLVLRQDPLGEVHGEREGREARQHDEHRGPGGANGEEEEDQRAHGGGRLDLLRVRVLGDVDELR